MLGLSKLLFYELNGKGLLLFIDIVSILVTTVPLVLLWVLTPVTGYETEACFKISYKFYKFYASLFVTFFY